MLFRSIISNPNVLCGNCIEEMSKMQGESIDLILTDPPFGIDLGKSQKFSDQKTYEDDRYTVFDMLDKAIQQCYRVLKQDRHMLIFFAEEFYSDVKSLLEKHGFWVHPLPLIWEKGSGSYPSQSTTFVHSYESFFHVMKGKRKLNGFPRDVFPYKRVPPDKKIHPTEKPTDMLRDLINLTTLAGEIVLDPFAGSGATIIAARETNRQGIGIELDPVYHEKIVKRLEETKDLNLEEENV